MIKWMAGLIGVTFGLFILWMNITAGFYQTTCSCAVEYLTVEEAEVQREAVCRIIGACKPSIVRTVRNTVLLSVSTLDFNR